MLVVAVIVFLGVIFSSDAASDEKHLSKKPSYIMPCSRSHNFNECAAKNGQYAIPFLVKGGAVQISVFPKELLGDRQLKIPSMNPLKVALVELKGTKELNLKLKDVEVYGLDKLKILSVETDFKKRKARIISALEKCVILAQYEIYGRIIVFPITGAGPLNLTMYNGIYQYDAEWNLVTREGKEYVNLTSSKYDYKVEKITYDFKNLFNGDKALSDQMNRILNENWEIVNEDLKAPYLETLLVFHNDISKKIYSQIPFDELFLP